MAEAVGGLGKWMVAKKKGLFYQNFKKSLCSPNNGSKLEDCIVFKAARLLFTSLYNMCKFSLPESPYNEKRKT